MNLSLSGIPFSGPAFLLVGLLLGMRHALEPDHLAAVSTLLTAPRRGGWGALAGVGLGMLWGLGHTLALLVVATLLALAGRGLPERLALFFELSVAAMLVVLGARSIRGAWRSTSRRHSHGHLGEELPATPIRRSVGRSLAIGVVHGLAGSGALTALVASRFPSVGGRLMMVSVFGVGSMLGMAALSGIAGWPLARLGRGPRAARWLGGLSGLFALGLGFFWGWPLVRQLVA